MKKLLLLLCFGIISAIAGTPHDIKVIYLPFEPPYRPFKTLYQAQGHVESSQRDSALNREEQAYGRVQIRAIRLRDFNRRTGKSYTLQDCYNEKISKEVWLFYATQFHYTENMAISKAWNGKCK